jgi:hypothetical protein
VNGFHDTATAMATVIHPTHRGSGKTNGAILLRHSPNTLAAARFWLRWRTIECCLLPLLALASEQKYDLDYQDDDHHQFK